MRLFAAIVIAAMVASCGARQSPNDLDDKLRKENQITALWTQIRDWRREMHMNVEPPRAFEIQAGPLPMAQVKQVCTEDHAVPTQCTDVCELAGAICDNAESICGIAAELGAQDDYAQEKCASAKASCREAKQRCCNCSKSPPEVP